MADDSDTDDEDDLLSLQSDRLNRHGGGDRVSEGYDVYYPPPEGNEEEENGAAVKLILHSDDDSDDGNAEEEVHEEKTAEETKDGTSGGDEDASKEKKKGALAVAEGEVDGAESEEEEGDSKKGDSASTGGLSSGSSTDFNFTPLTNAQMRKELEELRSRVVKARRAKLNNANAEELLRLCRRERHSYPISAKYKCRRLLEGHSGKIYAMAWAGPMYPDLICTASQDRRLIVWDGDSTCKTQAIPLETSWTMSAAFEQTRNGHVACGGLENKCYVFKQEPSTDIENGTPERTLDKHDGYIASCKFINVDKMLTGSGDHTCIRWDITTQAPESV